MTKSITFMLALAGVILAALLLLPDAPPLFAAASGSGTAAMQEQTGAVRLELPATRVSVPDPAPARNDCSAFEEMFAVLTRIWEESRAAGEKGLDAEHERGRGEFEVAVQRIRRCHLTAGERALLLMSEVAGGPVAPREPGLQCGGFLIRLALEDLQREYLSSRNRASLDAMVHSLLSTLELDQTLGTLIGEHLLGGRPHLGKAHEQKVLAFLIRDEARMWLRPIGEKLLLTLWRNLVAEGILSAAEVDQLAMALAGDPTATGRNAAILQLLVKGDTRHLPWILSLMDGEQDRSFRADVAMCVAAVFDPKVSLDSLVRMQSKVSPSSFTAAWIALGRRSPQLLREAYEARLADGIDKVTRYELVGAIGFGAPEAGLEALRIAFHHDPDQRVHGRALLCTASGPSRPDAERMLRSAIADKALRAHPQGPLFLAMGLSNYCGNAPDPDVVQEIGDRLLVIPNLAEEERTTVRGLMSRFAAGK